MEIFDNSFKEGQAEDIMTTLTIISQLRPADKKAYMESVNPESELGQKLQVVDEAYAAAKAKAEAPKVEVAKVEVAKVEEKVEAKAE